MIFFFSQTEYVNVEKLMIQLKHEDAFHVEQISYLLVFVFVVVFFFLWVCLFYFCFCFLLITAWCKQEAKRELVRLMETICSSQPK